MNKKVTVISATLHPPVGQWNFDSNIAPLEGDRQSNPVPVILPDGEFSWAHYWQNTDDGGKTVTEHGWSCDDPYGEQDTTIKPECWLELR